MIQGVNNGNYEIVAYSYGDKRLSHPLLHAV